MRKSSPLSILFNWVLFSVVVGYGFGWMGGGEELVLASALRHALQTVGVVTSSKNGNTLNSASVNYSYQVNGKNYFGYGHVESSKLTKLSPATPIDVMYLASDPSHSGVDLDAMRESGQRGLWITVMVEGIIACIFLPMLLAAGKLRLMIGAGRGNQPAKLLSGLAVGAFMLCVGLWMLFGNALPLLSKATELVSSSATANAQITGVYSKTKGKGKYVEYAFSVNGATYNGTSDFKDGSSSSGAITVHYLPSDPTNSAVDPQAKLDNAKVSVLFLGIWNGLVFAFVAGAFILLVRGRTRPI